MVHRRSSRSPLFTLERLLRTLHLGLRLLKLHQKRGPQGLQLRSLLIQLQQGRGERKLAK